MSKAVERKARLHVALVDSAERRIASDTVGQLRARDLAKDAGCSVGAIYNVFDDLDLLILHVSMRTLDRIDGAMAEAADASRMQLPVDQLVKLALTYFEFARDHHNLWRGLFDHVLPANYVLPGWVIDAQHALFKHIEIPLAGCMPDAAPENVQQTAKGLFAAVHGIVGLALEDRVIGVKSDRVPEELEFLLRTFVKGLQDAA